jgi:hypothetical protein
MVLGGSQNKLRIKHLALFWRRNIWDKSGHNEISRTKQGFGWHLPDFAAKQS